MTSIEHVEYPTEQALWFGPAERPLVGWLTTPPGELTRGGVILAPPIGQEAFSARRALRHYVLTTRARGTPAEILTSPIAIERGLTALKKRPTFCGRLVSFQFRRLE